MAIAIPERAGAVISYCHADKKHLDRLTVHLAPFVRNKKVDYWVDTVIKPGSNWRLEIDEAFASAKVAILLVSADFLASDFIAQNELPPLLTAAAQRKVVILTVILSPCAFEHTELVQYQAINPASSPLSRMNKHGRESIWAIVAVQVRDALNS